MKLILDTNIVIAALIKDSSTRKIILSKKLHLIYPEKVFEELRKHLIAILCKAKIHEGEFEEIFTSVLGCVEIIKEDMYSGFRDDAANIINDIDPGDTDFIACALANPGSILWSDDSSLKKQNRVKVLNTKEIALLI